MLSKQEMQNVIEAIIDYSYTAIQAEDYEAALKMLSKLEATCDVVVNHGDEIDPKIVLYILHNSSVCYQRLNNTHDSIAYLDACLYNIERYSSTNTNEVQGGVNYLELKKTEYSINLQIKLS